jgi:hypothetical protein
LVRYINFTCFCSLLLPLLLGASTVDETLEEIRQIERELEQYEADGKLSTVEERQLDSRLPNPSQYELLTNPATNKCFPGQHRRRREALEDYESKR